VVFDLCQSKICDTRAPAVVDKDICLGRKVTKSFLQALMPTHTLDVTMNNMFEVQECHAKCHLMDLHERWSLVRNLVLVGLDNKKIPISLGWNLDGVADI
jgi:hypothetical protein